MGDFNKSFGEFIELCKEVLQLYEQKVGNLIGDELLKNINLLTKLNITSSNTIKLKSCFEYIYLENNIGSKLKNFRKWIYEDGKIINLEFGKIKKIDGKFKFKKQKEESDFIYVNLSEIYYRIVQLTKIFEENSKPYEKHYKNCLYKLFRYSCENEEDIKLLEDYLNETNMPVQNDMASMINKDNIDKFKQMFPTILDSIGGVIPGGLDGLKQSGLDINKLIDGVCSTLENKDIQDNIGKSLEDSPNDIGGLMNNMMKLISDGKIINSIAQSMDLPKQDFTNENLQEDINKAAAVMGNIIPMVSDSNISMENLQENIKTTLNSEEVKQMITTETSTSTKQKEEEEDDYEIS